MGVVATETVGCRRKIAARQCCQETTYRVPLWVTELASVRFPFVGAGPVAVQGAAEVVLMGTAASAAGWRTAGGREPREEEGAAGQCLA